MSGYNYNFVVDNLPDRLLCQICQLPCRDPQRSVSCVHVFCKSELNTTMYPNEDISCPKCHQPGFNTFPDKALEREIKELKIYCPNKKDGCGWTGELSRVDNHLNECEITCRKCKQIVYFTTMSRHLDKDCPCYCPYCDSTADREVISSKHKEKCHKFPLTCPNNCGVDNIPQGDMDEHKKVCPLEMIQCEYGCGAMITRNDVAKHNMDNISLHIHSVKDKLAILFDNGTKLQKGHTEYERALIASTTSLSNAIKVFIFNVKIKALNEKCKEPPSDIYKARKIWLICYKWTILIFHVLKFLNILMVFCLIFYAYECYTAEFAKVGPTISDIDIHTSLAMYDLISDPYELNGVKSLHWRYDFLTSIKSLHWQWELQLKCWRKIGLVAPVIIEMPDIENYKNNKLTWFSNPFFAFEGGYQMCLRVDAAGYGDGKDTHISVYLHLMKGPHDDELSWPMRGEYTITLLNPIFDGEKYHHFLTVQFDTSVTTSVENYQRVTIGKMHPVGIGFPKYILYYDDAKVFTLPVMPNHQKFLSRHNSLYFKVSYNHIGHS